MGETRIYSCKTLGVKNFKFLKTILDGKNFDIIILCESCTSECSKIIQPEQNVEWFTIEELQHFIFDSRYVDLAVKVKPDELSELKNYYQSFKNFPYVKLNDPIVRYLGLKEGDLVKFTRTSDLSCKDKKTYRYYRYVTK